MAAQKPRYGKSAGKAKKAPPRQSIPSGSILSQVRLRGQKMRAEVSRVVVDATASVSTDAIGDLTLVIYDPTFTLLRSGLFDLGGRVDLGSHFRQEITQVDTGTASDTLGLVTIKCRSYFVGALKRRRGTKAMRNASPTDFVRAECKAVGVRVVAQPSARRKMVARDTKKSQDGAGSEKPSSWTTFERLARELGYVLFEAGGIIYFGKPTWLRSQDKQAAVITYGTGKGTDCIGIPNFTDQLDSDDGVSVRFSVPRSRVKEFMPGQLCKVRFPKYGNRTYLVKSLSFPIAGDGNADVTAGIPTNPSREKSGGRKGSGKSATSATNSKGKERRGSTQLGDVLRRAGFSGEGLEIAAGVAIATSGGKSKSQFYVDATFRNARWTDDQWGPRVGIFGLRSVHEPKKFDGINKRRIYSKMRGDALYSARLMHDLTKGGRDWSSMAAYRSGEWKQYKGKLGAHIRNYPGLPPKPKPPSSSGGSPPTPTGASGRLSALAFAARALAQAGDRYVYGAEVSLSDPNPSVFDCSELVQWAAAQVGGYMPDGSSNQAAYTASKHTDLPVETAIRTRGALLFASGHVAISLGDGRTIEALNSSYGVRVMNARGRQTVTWYKGARVPGLRY